MQLFLRLLKISVLKILQISKRASIWECFLNIIFIILEKQCLEWLGGLQLCLKITSTWLFSWKFAKFSKQLFTGTNLFIVIFLRLLIILFANFIHAKIFKVCTGIMKLFTLCVNIKHTKQYFCLTKILANKTCRETVVKSCFLNYAALEILYTF